MPGPYLFDPRVVLGSYAKATRRSDDLFFALFRPAAEKMTKAK